MQSLEQALSLESKEGSDEAVEQLESLTDEELSIIVAGSKSIGGGISDE